MGLFKPDDVRFEQSRILCSARGLSTLWGRANDRIDGMIEFIAGVMDWLEHRHCAVCGQYIGDDRECQSGVCVCPGCGEREGHDDFAEAERRSLGAPGRASGA